MNHRLCRYAAALPLAAIWASGPLAGCERKKDPPTAERELERRQADLMKQMDEIAAEHADEEAAAPQPAAAPDADTAPPASENPAPPAPESAPPDPAPEKPATAPPPG